MSVSTRSRVHSVRSCTLAPWHFGTLFLAAQISGGALVAHVSDGAGAAIPGALVTVTAIETERSRVAVSREDGLVFQGMAPGLYQVNVELSGWRPLTRHGIRIATGETVRLDLQLEVGGLIEAVTVTADIALSHRQGSGLGQVVDNRKVLELPLNGRTFVTLAALSPGVALPPGSAFPRINGGRPRTNAYLFDGISVLQPEPGQVAFFPSVDAIQEFKIEINSPPAEFGRFNGGVVNLTTKSGTNAVHGSAFEFFRHEALNARNASSSRTYPHPSKTCPALGSLQRAALATECREVGVIAERGDIRDSARQIGEPDLADQGDVCRRGRQVTLEVAVLAAAAVFGMRGGERCKTEGDQGEATRLGIRIAFPRRRLTSEARPFEPRFDPGCGGARFCRVVVGRPETYRSARARDFPRIITNSAQTMWAVGGKNRVQHAVAFT